MDFFGHLFGQIVGTLLLFLIILIAFGIMAGQNTDSLARAYVGTVIRIFGAFGQLLARISIPLLKDAGEKIVYVSHHYQKESQPAPPSAPPPPQPAPSGKPPEPPLQPPPPPQPKHSANPYDDPPEPEIMD